MLFNHDISSLSKDDLVRLVKAYQQATLDSILCSVTDTEGIIVYVNKMFCDVSKYAETDLIGKNHNIVNAGYHSKEYFNSLWDTISEGKVWHGEIMNRAKDGSLYWLDSVIVPIKDDAGNIVQYFSLRTLINEKKQAELDREAHIKSIESMLFMISHQIRHPIANIISISNVFEEYLASPDEMYKMIGFIKESALSLDAYTRELTGFMHSMEHKNKTLI